jgi:hypothetical protein
MQVIETTFSYQHPHIFTSLKISSLRLIQRSKLNFVAWVRERTIPTERPPLVGEVSYNFCGWRVPHGQRDGSLLPYSRISRPEPLLFLPSSSSVVLTRLSGPLSRSTTSQKVLYRRESNRSVAKSSDHALQRPTGLNEQPKHCHYIIL